MAGSQRIQTPFTSQTLIKTLSAWHSSLTTQPSPDTVEARSEALGGSVLVDLVGVEEDDVALLIGHGGDVDRNALLDVGLPLDEG